MTAYMLYTIHKKHCAYTAKCLASWINVSYSTYNRQINRLKYNSEKCNVIFLYWLCLYLQIDFNEMMACIEKELSPGAKASIKRVEDFIRQHDERMALLSANQRTAFYPTPLPKSFLNVTIDRLN